MRAIEQDRALLYFWADLVFLEAALLAREDTQALAALITAHLALFPEVFQASLTGQRQVLQAAARAAVADGSVDEVIRGMHSGALYETRQDRKAPFFLALFPEHIGAMVKHALARQIEVAEGIAGKLVLSLIPEPFRAAWQPKLAAVIGVGKAALAGRRTAALAQAETKLTVDAWKEEASALRLSVWSQLMQRAAAERLDKDWPEQFFLARGRSRKAAGSNQAGGDGVPDVVEEESVG